jgi:hypothetical protein
MWNLLWALAALFFAMWILGFALHVTAGGLIHLLLLLAIASIVFRIIKGNPRTA